jgi:hypothetical protein
MRSVTINRMGGVGISLLELWMNPAYNAEIEKNYKVNDNYYKDLFKRLDLSAGVNFINILTAALLYKNIVLCRFYPLTVCVCIFWQRILAKMLLIRCW